MWLSRHITRPALNRLAIFALDSAKLHSALPKCALLATIAMDGSTSQRFAIVGIRHRF
jgi:hypothetical protein